MKITNAARALNVLADQIQLLVIYLFRDVHSISYAKNGQAQSGQFVVKDRNGKFVYSEINRNPNYLFSRFMVEAMNNE